MTRKTKFSIAILAAILGVALVFSGIYWFTIGHTERSKADIIESARDRLEDETSVEVDAGELFTGTEAYVTFEQTDESVIWFVPVDEALAIENRPLGETTASALCERDLDETGGTLVSCKYGFDERALVEVVVKADTTYTYSYYTLAGEFLRRVQLAEAP